MFDMARDHGYQKDQIMAKPFVENFVNIFFIPPSDVHIKKVGAHKDVGFITIL